VRACVRARTDMLTKGGLSHSRIQCRSADHAILFTGSQCTNTFSNKTAWAVSDTRQDVSRTTKTSIPRRL